MVQEYKMEKFIENLPAAYLVNQEFSLPRPAIVKLKEKSMEEDWTLNQALTVLINKKIEEI